MRELFEYCHKYKHIYCYGAGKYGRALRVFLYCHGIDIDGFVTTTKYQYAEILKKKVYALDEISYSDDTIILLGVSPKYRNEMISELDKRGISNRFVLDQSQLTLIVENIKPNDGWVNLADHLVCVLLYHRVNAYKSDYWGLSITPEMFASHLDTLQQNFSVVRFGDNWETIKKFSIAVTFDDGYADNYKYALPILEKYKVPATIFVSTGNIGTSEEFWWDKLATMLLDNVTLPPVLTFDGEFYETASLTQRLQLLRKFHPNLKRLALEDRESFFQRMIEEMDIVYKPNEENRSVTVEELQEMGKSPYIDIGVHTVTHTALSVETEKRQREEIHESKVYLERTLERSIDTFSYPFGAEGDFTNATEVILERYGFRKAATTTLGATGSIANPMRIPRFRVPFCCDAEQLLDELNNIFLTYA